MQQQQDWNAVTAMFQWHTLGLLSDLDFLSLVEAELLPQWAESVHDWLSKRSETNPTDLVTVASKMYGAWRFRILGVALLLCPTEDYKQALSFQKSQQLLRDDDHVCGCFYSVLLMIQAACGTAASCSNLEKHVVPIISLHDLAVSAKSSNYRLALARRKKEAKLQAANDLLRMEESQPTSTNNNSSGVVEARVRLSNNNRNHGHTPTFREVVEEYARERDILFQPRMGIHALNPDGKQIFLFGRVPIYLDGNVVYARQENSVEWKALSLDAVAAQAQSAVS